MTKKLYPKRYENYEAVLAGRSEAFKEAYGLVFPNLIVGANWALVRVRGPLTAEKRKEYLAMHQDPNVEVLQVKNGFVITINRELAYTLANAITGGLFSRDVMAKMGQRHLNELWSLEAYYMNDLMARGDYEVGIYNVAEPGTAGITFLQNQSVRFAVTVRELIPRISSDHVIKTSKGRIPVSDLRKDVIVWDQGGKRILVSDPRGTDDQRRIFLQQCRITRNSTALMCPLSHNLDERRRRNG